jgi:hypothetical protein
MANTAASRTANRERTDGRWQPFTDAGPASQHLTALRAPKRSTAVQSTHEEVDLRLQMTTRPTRAEGRRRPRGSTTSRRLTVLGEGDAPVIRRYGT